MKGRLNLSLEGWVGLYLLLYLPNVMITRYVTTTPHPGLGRPLTGLETLPASLIFNWLITYAFIWLSGWHRDASAVRLGPWRFPVPTWATFLSGIGTALVLFTVPLSFTFRGVSIPFIQLIMRGDILIIAPVIDLMFGRKVRWWSWAALAMVMGALVLTLADRGGLKLPPLAILTVVLYTLGYFIRLAVMNRISKNGDPASVRRYFVEEKMIALPLSVAALAAVSALGLGEQAGELGYGFFAVWTDPVILPLFLIGFTLAMIGVVAIIILLDPNENAYCVPLERAASLVAGVGGAVLLAWFFGGRMPRPAELAGAAILIAAIVLLSVAPRLSARRTRISLSDAPAASAPEI
jgi:drug/metabolite transporter (DMT)-like permease